MANPQLADWIRCQEAKGYTQQQVYSYLIRYGLHPDDIDEAMDDSAKPQPKHTDKKMILIGIAVFAVLVLAALAFWYITKPVCGNGAIERGETPDTCCLDAGCTGQQSCEYGVCVEPGCRECEYLKDHVCQKYPCCDDLDCDDGNPDTVDTCLNPISTQAKCANSPNTQAE